MTWYPLGTAPTDGATIRLRWADGTQGRGSFILYKKGGAAHLGIEERDETGAKLSADCYRRLPVEWQAIGGPISPPAP